MTTDNTKDDLKAVFSSDDMNIVSAINPQRYPVEKQDWKYLKGTIQDIKCKNNTMYSIAIALLSIGIATVITILSSNKTILKISSNTIIAVIGIALIVSALSFFLNGRKERDSLEVSKEYAIKCMSNIEAKFKEEV